MPGKKKAGSTDPTPKAASRKKTPVAKTPRAKAAKIPKAKVPKAPRAVKEPKLKTPKKVPANLKSTKPGTLLRPIPAGRFPRQGETRMVAFVRDPLCIFTYWEVTPESVDAVKGELMEEFKGSSMVLRVFRTGANGEVTLLREIQVKPGEMNRYVELTESSGVYFIEVAQKTKSGRVAVYARSNPIALGPSASWTGGILSSDPRWEPPAGLLEYFSEEWEAEGAGSPSRGLSSAEAQKKARSRYSSSHIG